MTTQARILADRRRAGILIFFGSVVFALLVIKSFQDDWFEPQTPLELNDQPALVFFTLGSGCECQMVVVRSAEAQMADWPLLAEKNIQVVQVDFNRRPDLVKRYNVARAPALVLLGTQGQVLWKQDLGLSDEAPLDLTEAENQVKAIQAENDEIK